MQIAKENIMNVLGESLIRADDFRKMKKVDTYKDVLVIRENILYTPRMYDVEYCVYREILANIRGVYCFANIESDGLL